MTRKLLASKTDVCNGNFSGLVILDINKISKIELFTIPGGKLNIHVYGSNLEEAMIEVADSTHGFPASQFITD